MKQVPELSRVSSKGQLVIPQEIRKDLCIKEGDIFAATSTKHNMIILKKIENPILKKDLTLVSAKL